MVNKTIAAIATAQAPAGVGIIRISGAEAKAIASKVFVSRLDKNILNAAGYSMLYGNICSGEVVLDDAVALVFTAPKSYTGEDVVELSCHGGMYNLQRVLHLVLEAGASLAEAGEFTKRAFLNGKLALNQAEAVMDLISAQNEQALRLANASREGALNLKLNKIKAALLDLTAKLAVWADYPEDDIDELENERLLEALQLQREELLALLATYKTGKLIAQGIGAVILGKPNVGKSTLMNLLSGCARSIVTDIPGTTRDIVEEAVNLGDITLRIADTAGIRETDDPVESLGVELALKKLESADLVLAVFDNSQPLGKEDFELLKKLKGKNAIAILNKSDVSQIVSRETIWEYGLKTVEISALSWDPLEALQAAVRDCFNGLQLNPSAGVLANERQYEAVGSALAAVEEALAAAECGFTLDAITVSLEGTLAALYELTGERASEQIVNQIFEKFCVGK
ncbi:MAG: tRNA uridine-5-carboxymethylaminomethyl(34) synthesis GTPase MnmE [Oscillospiraceae bacterium]|jgi:tRNA modification GTPase|nr:tRNA uridine-5-carboxymethylaminomethyl(34) synthesis GTPase MnmE [Oscillospiraceae bacterium]